MSTPVTSVVCTGVDFFWPDGERVFRGLTTTFGIGRCGLIGVNGSGTHDSSLKTHLSGDC